MTTDTDEAPDNTTRPRRPPPGQPLALLLGLAAAGLLGGSTSDRRPSRRATMLTRLEDRKAKRKAAKVARKARKTN